MQWIPRKFFCDFAGTKFMVNSWKTKCVFETNCNLFFGRSDRDIFDCVVTILYCFIVLLVVVRQRTKQHKLLDKLRTKLLSFIFCLDFQENLSVISLPVHLSLCIKCVYIFSHLYQCSERSHVERAINGDGYE